MTGMHLSSKNKKNLTDKEAVEYTYFRREATLCRRK